MEKKEIVEEIVEEKLSKSLLEKKERRRFNLMGKRLNCNARSVAMPSDMCDLKDDKVTNLATPKNITLS